MSRGAFFSLLLSAALTLFPTFSSAQDPGVDESSVPIIELGEEYQGYAQERVPLGVDHSSTLKKVFLFLPNRLLDLYDVFRLDVGIGPALGAVVRVTKYGQVGYRKLSPGSLRVGFQGRAAPIFVETSSEFGIGPFYVPSHDRKVTPVELGAGADVLIGGAYFGVSFDELADFVGGFFGLDFKRDDIR